MATPEEVLAHTLHIISSSTSTSSLAIHHDGSVRVLREESENSRDDIQLTPTRDVSNDVRDGLDWLESMAKTPEARGAVDNDAAIQEVMELMVNMSDLPNEREQYKDSILWSAGLKLIHHVVSDDKIDEFSDDAIEPHILLSTLMDSYYYNDGNELFDDKTRQNYHVDVAPQLSTSQAMFVLRSFLVTIAIERSVQLTRIALESSNTIRWRRLKSILDDSILLFQKMFINQIDLSRDIDSTDSTKHAILMGTNIYVNNIFPAARDLLQLLLENTSDASFITRILKASYNCFDVLTSLAALGFAFGENGLSSEMTNAIMKCIDDPKTDDLFQLMKNKNAFDVNEDDEHQSINKCCLLRNNSVKRGLHFREDLLLYPFIQRIDEIQNDKSDWTEDQHNDDDSYQSSEDDDYVIYDTFGVAVVACIQTRSLPLIYSREFIWFLFFPHVHIFLSGMMNTSTTLNLINENQFDETAAINTGLSMLENLMSDAPGMIGSYESALTSDPSTDETSTSTVYCTMMLAATIESLLSTVMRLSMFEASHDRGADSKRMLYSSRQVMSMIQSLLELYEPIIQVHALASLSQKMKCMEHTKVLLPRVLDWVRSVIMKICIEMREDQSNNSEANMIHSQNVNVILAVIDSLAPFLQELEFAFDKTKPPLPKCTQEFMSKLESYISTLSVFRSIRLWVHCVETIAKNNAAKSNAKNDSFHHVKQWSQQNEAMLVSFSELLVDLIDFWTRACSPRDAKVYVGEDMEPPIGWHRLNLLLHAVEDSLCKFDYSSC